MGRKVKRLGKANNELEIIYNYFENMYNAFDSESYHKGSFYDEEGNDKIGEEQLLYFLSELRGFNAFPSVLSGNDYNNSENEVFYHGFDELGYVTKFFDKFKYHFGAGNYGGGFYVTSGKENALNYTGSSFFKDFNHNRVCEIKLKNEAKGIKFSNLLTLSAYLEHGKFGDEINQKDKEKLDCMVAFCRQVPDSELGEELIRILADNTSAIAVYLGYDFVDMGIVKDHAIEFVNDKLEDVTKHFHHCIILNRAMIEVNENFLNKYRKIEELER